MHTFPWKGRSEVSHPHGTEVETAVMFYHNGDYSGRVTINLPTDVAEPATRNFSEGGEDHHIAEIKVPFDALLAFVLEAIRDNAIKDLENMTYEQVARKVVQGLMND